MPSDLHYMNQYEPPNHLTSRSSNRQCIGSITSTNRKLPIPGSDRTNKSESLQHAIEHMNSHEHTPVHIHTLHTYTYSCIHRSIHNTYVYTYTTHPNSCTHIIHAYIYIHAHTNSHIIYVHSHSYTHIKNFQKYPYIIHAPKHSLTHKYFMHTNQK